MDFEIGPAIGAGLIAGAAMSAVLYMGIAMMPAQMKMNLFLMLGSMMFTATGMAVVAGAMIHAVMSIVFGLIHVGVIVAADLDANLWAWGLLFGLVHWAVAGMGLAMMSTMHPAIKRGDLPAPGAFAMSYPPMTAAGFFMLHILFGVLTGALYEAFV